MIINNKDIIYTIVIIIIILVIYYFGTEQKRREQLQLKKMQESLKQGDKVVTISGIIGTIDKIDNDMVTILTSVDKTKIQIEKWAIVSLLEQNNDEKNKS